MAFGQKQRGMFGRQLPGVITGYGGGTFDLDGSQVTPVDQPDDFGLPSVPTREELGIGSPQPAKPGLFGRGGVGRSIAGYVGDALLQQADMQPIYAPQIERQQLLAEQQRQASLKRETDWQDYIRKQEYEAAHPKAHVNDTELDYEFWQSKLTPQEFEQWKANKIDPPRYVQGADGQYYRVDPPKTPTAPVGKLTPITGGPQASPAATFP